MTTTPSGEATAPLSVADAKALDARLEGGEDMREALAQFASRVPHQSGRTMVDSRGKRVHKGGDGFEC